MRLLLASSRFLIHTLIFSFFIVTVVKSSQPLTSANLINNRTDLKTNALACGDFGVGSNRFQAGIAYLFAAGPPPIDASVADVDDHVVFTIADLCAIYSHDDGFSTPLICPPTQASLHLLPPDSSTVFTVSPSEIAAGESKTTVTISFESSRIIGFGIEIPLKIDVCGQSPAIDNINVTSLLPFGVLPSARGFTYDDSNGILILYFIGSWVPNRQNENITSNFFASFDIHSVPSVTCVPINYSLVETGPMTDSGPTNIPLFVRAASPLPSIYIPYRPILSVAPPDSLCGCSPICCHPPITGDVNNNDGISILDLIYLVQYCFNNGPVPPCSGEADINGNGGVSVLDIIYLVQYFFNNGPNPAACLQ